MPVVIEELTSNFEIRDEAKIRTMVREEVKKALSEERRTVKGAQGAQDDGDISKRRSDPEP